MNTIVAAAATWEPIAPLPEPNGGFVAGAVGGRVVIAGGTTWKDGAKQWLDRIHTFDLAANAWRAAGRLDVPLAYAAVDGHAGALWLAGGTDGAQTHRAVRIIDRSFTVKTAFPLAEGFALAGGGVMDGALYVLGGTDDMNNLARATNVFRAVDLRTGRVTKLLDYPEPAFITGASAVCGARFFAFGGARWDAAVEAVANLSAAHAFDPAMGRWEKLAPLPYAVRGLTACALDDTRLLLAGGYKNDTEEFTDAAFLYDTRTDRYTATTPLPYRGMVALVKLDDWLYCLGGEDRKKSRTAAAFRIRWKELK